MIQESVAVILIGKPQSGITGRGFILLEVVIFEKK
jgi:hypothetical protein